MSTPLTLVIANKAYSSWSMRPWLALAHFGVPFNEIVVPLGRETTRDALLAYAPTGKAPVLIDGDTRVWDSLAILEYLAERFPDHPFWPRDMRARAAARSVSAEMHSSFQVLRTQCPMNFRRAPQAIAFTPEALADIARIQAIWTETRAVFGGAGSFLFGAFSAADAMFAPVVNRLAVYRAPVDTTAQAYMDAMQATPAWARWRAGAQAEPWRIDKYENV